MSSSVDTALYYTFSTISQTLAAAVALLAGFALYRLQGLSKVLEDTSLTILESYAGADHGRVNSLRVAADFAGFRKAMHDLPSVHLPTAEPYASRRATFETAFTTSARIRLLLNWSLGLTVAVILLAVVVLTRGPVIATGSHADLVLCLGLIGTAVCLCVYAALVRVALS
jgi:hypothetical protein